MSLVIGIDAHKASHMAVAIDGEERPVGECEVSADQSQTHVCRREPRCRVRSELGRTSPRTSLGSCCPRKLVAGGELLIDVPPTLSARGGRWDHRRPRRMTASMLSRLRSRGFVTAGCVPCDAMDTRPNCNCSLAATTISSRLEPRPPAEWCDTARARGWW